MYNSIPAYYGQIRVTYGKTEFYSHVINHLAHFVEYIHSFIPGFHEFYKRFVILCKLGNFTYIRSSVAPCSLKLRIFNTRIVSIKLILSINTRIVSIKLILSAGSVAYLLVWFGIRWFVVFL